MLKVRAKAFSMAVSNWQLNPFERFLFRVALVLACVLVAVRLGAVAVVWYLHHLR
jgi:hypothetical protein